MPLSRTVIAAIFCGALLSMQLSGLHMHVNPQGDSGDLHVSHVHNAESDGHSHNADVDVSVLEVGATWSKMLTFLLPIVIMLLGIFWVLQTVWSPPRVQLSLQRRSRWRPPLRAPPFSP